MAEIARQEEARLAAIAAEEAKHAAERAEQERLEKEKFMANELENLRELSVSNETMIK